MKKNYMFIKIGKYNNAIINGEIFFNSPKFWRDLELKNKKQGQGDKQEGKLSEQTVLAIDLYDTGNPDEYIVIHPQPNLDVTSNIGEKIFCVYGINDENTIYKNECYQHIIPWEMIKDFVEYDDIHAYTVLIVLDVNWFINEIVNAKGESCSLLYGAVEYDDHDFECQISPHNDQIYASMETYLHKSAKYINQHEFRFIIADEKFADKPNYIININALEKKAIEIPVEPECDIYLCFNSEVLKYKYMKSQRNGSNT